MFCDVRVYGHSHIRHFMCLGVTHVHAKHENTHMIIFAHRYIYTLPSYSKPFSVVPQLKHTVKSLYTCLLVCVHLDDDVHAWPCICVYTHVCALAGCTH